MRPVAIFGRGIRLPFIGLSFTWSLLVLVLFGVIVAPQLWAQSGTAEVSGVVQFQCSVVMDRGRAVVRPVTHEPGYAVALSGDYAIVGVEWDDGFKGAAYVFKRSGGSWGEPQKLSPSDLGRFDHFGSSVSICGDYAAVGATWQSLFRGAVYVFRRMGSEWVEEQKLIPRDARPESRFGRALRIDGDEIVVGAMASNHDGSWPNLVYRFQRTGNTWVEVGKTALPAVEGVAADVWGSVDEPVTGSSVASSSATLDWTMNADVLTLAEALRAETGEPLLVPLTAPPEPDTVIATDGTFEDHVQVMWSNAGLDAVVYKILRDGTPLSVASSMDSLYLDYAAVPGTVYDYCVVVKNMWGEESAPKCDSGSCVIFAPRDVRASDGEYDQFVRVTWTDVSAVEAGYRVKRDDILIGQTGANAGLFDDTTAVPGSENTYNYEVIAFDALARESEARGDDGFRGLILPPLYVSASYGEYVDSVRITWTDQATDETGYRIYRDSALHDSTLADVTSYTDTSPVPGTEHDYCVATKGVGSIESIWVCAKGGVGILPAPSGVAASDSTFDNRVEITWQDNSSNEDGFEIRRDGVPIDSTSANATSYKDYTATFDFTHTYCVVAYSNEGGRSVADSCDTGFRSLVVVPYEVSATDGTFENRVDITWKSSSTTAVLFKVYRDTTCIKSVSKGTRSYSDYIGTAGQMYDYSVSAVTAVEAEAIGLSDEGRRELKPPTSVTAGDEEYEDRIVISWVDNSQLEHGYVVSREDSATAEVDTSYTIGPNRTSFTDYSASPGVTYRYSVSAFDSLSGAVGYSGPAEDLGRRVLLRPTGVLASNGEFEDQVEVTWQDNSKAEDGYHIYRGALLVGSTGDNFTSYVDTSPVLGERSLYSVAAFDAYGESEAASDSGYTTILAPVSLNASDVYEDRVELTWVDVSEVETGYEILRDDVPLDTTDADVTAFTDYPPLQGVEYEYCVRALGGGGLVASGFVCEDGLRLLPSVGPETIELDLKLVASDGDLFDRFGWSVAVSRDSGDVAVVGAPYDNDKGSESGSAYVFTRDAAGTWAQTQKLLASDGAAYHLFGSSVAVSGDVAIVGAHGYDYEKGAAYVFTRDAGGTWTQTQKLVASDGDVGDNFGWSVAVSGDVAIVGAYGEAESGMWNSGAAYVFTRDAGGTWTQTQKLVASDRGAYDEFGISLAVDGDIAIIGAHYDTDQGPESGSAYIFTREGGTWTQTQKLLASDGGAYDEFGLPVAVSGNAVMVGALFQYPCFVYVFTRDAGGTWNETQKLLPSDVPDGGDFGRSLATSGDLAIISETYGRGAYVFTRHTGGGWIERKVLSSPAGSSWLLVAVDGELVIVGDPGSEAAYVIELVKEPGDVAASDGTLNSRVRLTWDDRSMNEHGFRIYRDADLIANVEPNVEVYEDFDAEPGRTYEYSVACFISNVPFEGRASDYGWRPPNGNITGQVSTRVGAAVEGIYLGLDPVPAKALLLDGAGGYVSVPDEDAAFNFDTDTSFTVEAWVKYLGDGGSGAGDGTVVAKTGPGGTGQRYPFLLSNMRGTGDPGRLSLAMSDGTTTVSVTSDSTGFNDNTWHHVACVHDAVQDEIRIYVDGDLQGTTAYSPLGDITNTDSLSLGVGAEVGTWFGGQIDEVRIWSVARDSSDIRSSMEDQLTGEEDGLVAYWSLDEGSSGIITDLASGAHYGLFEGGVYWTENSAPLDIYAVTGGAGSYVLPGIRYGSQTTFKVRPFEGERQFEPAFKLITLSTEHPVENQVNFADISSYTVSGVIEYEGVGCAAEGVQILVDSEPAGVTDKNGKFAVPVDIGEHSVRPSLEGHTFEPDSITLLVEEDVSGLAFADMTKRRLSGYVGGGCGRSIGDVTISIRSENNCLLESFTADSAYSALLPPQKYLVTATVVESSIPEGLIKSDVVKFFQNLGERQVQMDTTDAVLDMLYRAPLRVAIKGFEPYTEQCPGALTFEGRTLPDSLPVVPQGTVVDVIIEVNEDYGSGGLCPLDSGRVTIYDEVFDQEGHPVELEVIDGEAVYITFACTPSLVVGRVDSQGNDRTFQKAVRAVVEVEGRAPVTGTEWVLVTGHVAGEGADFVTGAVDIPLYILRDPPGDQSHAFLEEGHTSRTRIHWDENLFSWKVGPTIKVSYGLDIYFWYGLGAGQATQVEAATTFSTDWLFGTVEHEQWITDITYATQKTFSTSASELLAGVGGDVFVGAGFNFIFSEVGVIGVDGCEVTRSTSVGFQPDSLETVYAYTQQYIENVLIPELDEKVKYYEGLAETDESKQDSVGVFQAKLNVWQDILAANDSLKQAAALLENRSFSAGADFTYFEESGQTDSYSRTLTFVTDGDFNLGEFKTKWAGLGWAFGLQGELHHEDILSYEDTTGTATTSVGYTLSDDDIGDHFTVGIKNDGRYPSPVFDVLAGVSSCPYEAWPNPETGAARMVPRDKPRLDIEPPELIGIPPDAPAVFTLNLSNLSPTQESRLYELRLLTASNPYGAVVRVGGVPIANGLSYFIDPTQSQQATLTVERGPTRYAYDNLAVILYPPCEYEVWEQGGPLQQSDTLYFSVKFEAPCSDITLYRPEPGWAFNKTDQDTGRALEMWLTDYELEVGDKELTSVGVQYRHVGIGREGPSEWEDIDADSLGTVETIVEWFPPDSLRDGVYELQAYAQCAGGRGYSDVSVGTIDRHGPEVFGTPEPADGELSLGEDISITFNEPIDCRSVDADSVLLRYLDGLSAGDTIDVETVCDGRTIIITPAPGVDPDSLEGRLLVASVSGIRDLLGNRMEGERTWSFSVRRSAFTWSKMSVTADVAFRNPGSLSAELVNGSDSTASFTITGIPGWVSGVWIGGVEGTSGELEPGGTESISFFIQENLAEGSYDGEVVASSGQGDAVLGVHLTVSCHDPEWVVDATEYEHTMTVVAELDIGGTVSTDPDDQVAAFVGNQLRGVANLEMGASSYLAFLTVYSNRVSGETVRFQVWDADSCRHYNSTLEHYAFVSNGRIGSADSPVTLTATDVFPDTLQVIALTQGWNWFSTYVEASDMSVNGVLSDLNPASGDIIKSLESFATFDPELGWSGPLDTLGLDNVSCYMIRLSEPGTIMQEGSLVDPAAVPVPIADGWNWIGYLPSVPMGLDSALVDLQSILSSGDMVKSQTEFAQYGTVGGTGWYGGLDVMEPGKGYKLYLADTDLKTEFYYDPSQLIAVQEPDPGIEDEFASGVLGWSVAPGAYEHNMTVVAVLSVEGKECRSAGDLIGAFVDGECRGLARPVYEPGLDRYVAYLMVYSNEVSGELVTFKGYVESVRAVYSVLERLAYGADAAAGTLRQPLRLSAGEIEYRVPEALPRAYALWQNYPNPFNPATTIRFELPEDGRVVLRVYNVSGRQVRTLVERPYEAGYHSVVWDGRDDEGRQVASGVYFCKIKAGEYEQMKKMVLLK